MHPHHRRTVLRALAAVGLLLAVLLSAALPSGHRVGSVSGAALARHVVTDGGAILGRSISSGRPTLRSTDICAGSSRGPDPGVTSAGTGCAPPPAAVDTLDGTVPAATTPAVQPGPSPAVPGSDRRTGPVPDQPGQERAPPLSGR